MPIWIFLSNVLKKIAKLDGMPLTSSEGAWFCVNLYWRRKNKIWRNRTITYKHTKHKFAFTSRWIWVGLFTTIESLATLFSTHLYCRTCVYTTPDRFYNSIQTPWIITWKTLAFISFHLKWEIINSSPMWWTDWHLNNCLAGMQQHVSWMKHFTLYKNAKSYSVNLFFFLYNSISSY